MPKYNKTQNSSSSFFSLYDLRAKNVLWVLLVDKNLKLRAAPGAWVGVREQSPSGGGFKELCVHRY